MSAPKNVRGLEAPMQPQPDPWAPPGSGSARAESIATGVLESAYSEPLRTALPLQCSSDEGERNARTKKR